MDTNNSGFNQGGGGDLPIVSVYINFHLSLARSLISALYCHGYSKFGLGLGGGGVHIKLYCDGYSQFGQVVEGSPPLPCTPGPQEGAGGGGGGIAPLAMHPLTMAL